ncbi:HupE/UreJ family protein [Rhodoligotrophos ferricapiens]|uniref:HupE/UreJ family protein n=1 Tax=Rhodoligotrophos ferricapiens TaxID=3069264 RepID=UPI00315CA607
MKLRCLMAWLLLAATAVFHPSIAFAHTGLGSEAGFVHGFLHPFTGMDHTLAMLAVGIVAYQIGGRALWLVPVSFVLAMAVGGVLGMWGVNVPFVELGIALSVIVLGAAIALGMPAPLAAVMAIVGLFAIFHGHAHGTEIPESASGLTYGLGFMGATGLLHLGGIGIGLLIGWAGKNHERVLARAAGGLMSIAGIGILAGMM